jgi:hypothetical protein
MARGNPLFTAVLTGGNLTLPQSQVAASGGGPGVAIPINHAGSSQVTIIWSAGCTGGQVDVEISDMPNEPASWWPFQSVTLPANPCQRQAWSRYRFRRKQSEPILSSRSPGEQSPRMCRGGISCKLERDDETNKFEICNRSADGGRFVGRRVSAKLW